VTELAVAFLQIRCPLCQHPDVMKPGITAQGKPRYRGQHPSWADHTFLVESSPHGRWPAGTQHMLEMTLNGRGMRDMARVLHSRPTTVSDV
jgi:transposase-like protein